MLWGEVAAIMGMCATLLGVAFNMGKLSKEVSVNTELAVKTFNLVSNQDDRIDGLEGRVIAIETTCHLRSETIHDILTK